MLVRAQREARAAADLLRDVRDRADVAAFLEPDGSADLERAEAKFRRAERLFENPLLAPLRLAPVGGRQIRSAGSISGAAADALDAGISVLIEVRRTIGDGVPTGPARVAAVESVARATRDAATRLAAVDLGPTEGLIGSLVDARNEAATNLQKSLDLVEDASLISHALTTLLGGPSEYVLFAANSAEMRAGAGMYLQMGTLTFSGGSFTLGDMTSVTDIDVPPDAVPATGDMAERWGFLQPTDEWRNLNASPRFDATSPYAIQMWQAATGRTAQGVIALDPFALQAIVRTTGPVVLADGREINASNVVPFLLHDQYEGLEEDPESALRRDMLHQIAKAAVNALGTTSLDPVVFVRQLIDIVHGRHLLVWSQDATMQEAWTRVGVAGALDEDSLAVSILNRGTNKLDQYLDVDANLQVGDAVGGLRPAELRITIANQTPDGEPGYIAGPRRFAAYGEYIALVAVNLPGWSRNARIDGLDRLVVVGGDGPTRVVGGTYSIAQNASVTVVVRFDVPEDRESVHVEPSARPNPMTWTVGDRDFRDDRAHTVSIR